MMTMMVKTISTLYGANHRSGRRDGQRAERQTARSVPLFSPRCIWPASGAGRENRPERGQSEGESDHVGAFPNFLVKGLIALPLPGRTDSSFSVDSSVILNQVYTFAATA